MRPNQALQQTVLAARWALKKLTMLRNVLLFISMFWANAALAKLPAVVEDGMGRLALSVTSFFIVLVACAIAGALSARRLAPASRSARQLIFSLFSLAGVALGTLVAIKVVPG